MRRWGVAALLAVVLLGTHALAVVGAGEERTLAFTLGVPAGGAVATLKPGETACQSPVPVSSDFDAVELQAGTFRRPGPPLAVTVSRPDGGPQLANGLLAAGYTDFQRQTVPVGEVESGGYAKVCITNEGRRRVALYGAGDPAARTSSATLDGRPLGADIDLVFRTEPRTTLTLVPDVIERAALFRGGWIGAWLYWIALAAVVLGVPALLCRALATAVRDVDDARRVP